MKAKDWVKRILPLKPFDTAERSEKFLELVNGLEQECRELIVSHLTRLESKKDVSERDYANAYRGAIVEASSKWNAVAHGVANGGPEVFPLCRGLIAMDLISFLKDTITRKNDLLEKFGPKHGRYLVVALFDAVRNLPISVGFHQSPMAPKLLGDLEENYAIFLAREFQSLLHRGAAMSPMDYMNVAAQLRKEVNKLSPTRQMAFAAVLGQLHMGNAFKTRGVGY